MKNFLRVWLVLAFSGFALSVQSAPITLTFVPLAGNGQGTITLPDDSLLTTGRYYREPATNIFEERPGLSGWASAIFPPPNEVYGEIQGGLPLPNFYWGINLMYANGIVNGGYMAVGWADELFEFNWRGSGISTYSNGWFTPVNAQTPGYWVVSGVPVVSTVSLFVLGLGVLAWSVRRPAIYT